MPATERVPPLTANVNLACYVCFKEEGQGVTNLLRCSRCRRVSYCGPKCQKAHWNQHRSFCKASHATENNRAAFLSLKFSLADVPCTDFEFLNTIAEEQAGNKLQFLQLNARRPLTLIERNLIGWEPRCMACVRTEQDIRMETKAGPKTPTRNLKPCTNCKLTFFCCEDHREAVQAAHAEQPCEDGRDGLSQCQMNQEILADICFSESRSSTAELKWRPERVKRTWMSLKNATWSSEFEAELLREFRLSSDAVSPYLRAASNGLTMPLTILWALENLNQTNAWTLQDTLTIHILGASFDREVSNIEMFEELLHQLPEIKTLKLQLFGPELAYCVGMQEKCKVLHMGTCSNCREHGRKGTYQYFALTYHEYAQEVGSKYMEPDLAVAFNSGSSQQAVESWKETVKLLVKHHTPTIFTAFNKEEAEAEAQLLRAAGAHLVGGLGPGRNPWSSIVAKKEPNRVIGYYSVNGWFAGGFK